MSELQKILQRRRTLNGEAGDNAKESDTKINQTELDALEKEEDVIPESEPEVQSKEEQAATTVAVSVHDEKQEQDIKYQNKDVLLEKDAPEVNDDPKDEATVVVDEKNLDIVSSEIELEVTGVYYIDGKEIEKEHKDEHEHDATVTSTPISTIASSPLSEVLPKTRNKTENDLGLGALGLDELDDFLGDDLNQDLNALFEGEVNQRKNSEGSTTTNIESSEAAYDGITDFNFTTTEQSQSQSAKMRGKKSSLFDDDDNADDRIATPNSTFSSRSRQLSGGDSRGFGSSRRISMDSQQSTFDSPQQMRDMFHELVEEGSPTMFDMTVNDSGFVDGGGFAYGRGDSNTGMLALDALMGSAPKMDFSPRASLSELGLQSNIFKNQRNKKKVSQDEVEDSIDRAIMREVESPGAGESSFSDVPSPMKSEINAATTATTSTNVVQDKAIDEVMDMEDFEHRLSLPHCSDLRDVISRFIWSILGPSGNGTAPNSFQDGPVGTKFIGTKNMGKRCSDFFEAMDAHFRAHPRWSHESEEKLNSVRDCLENHCMSRLATLAYDYTARDCEDDDNAYYCKVCCLQFLKPENLDIKPELRNEQIWSIAGSELSKISNAVTPAAKNNCIVKCAAIIFRAMSLVSRKMSNGKNDGSEAGADEFLPLFIWVVLRAKVPKLIADCDYIETFINPDKLMGKDGYCLMNLRSALMFISELNAESVTMDNNIFDRFLKEAQDQFYLK